ncbi:Type II secretion system (T2SS), protein F [uncultured archaeon]|nr:Type II secretion system (T2SS), protein F [uncultured archaeon]
MAMLDELKGQIEVQKKKGQKDAQQEQQEKPRENIDIEQVDRIVEKMQKKYRDDGMDSAEVSGKLVELRGIVAEGHTAQLNIEKAEDLKDFKSPAVKTIGAIYISMKSIFGPATDFVNRLPVASDVRYYLFSANMRYSAKQWIALSLVTAAIVAAFTFAMTLAAAIVLEVSFAFPVLIAMMAGFFGLVIMLIIPRSRANSRGNDMSAELPFALRQMATELRAGIGLYKAMQTISTSDYGVLSEEFGRTIIEIEEGSDTKDALKHFALRSQSKSLRSAIFHLIRALKTGGNLSDIMNDIAQDVSFDIRIKISDFAEKMNFFGVIYIFLAIVAPVFVGILGTVTNAPVTAFGSMNLPPVMIAVIYMIGFPFILAAMTFYMKLIEPKV